MKIASEIALPVAPEPIWAILTDFAAYPEWNRVLKAVRGNAAADASLEVDLQYYGQPMSKRAGSVTGFIAPKYFSWIWNHKLGTWFTSVEHVFRLKDKGDGRTIFFQEVYYTGLGIRFRRRDVEHTVRLSLDKLNEDLKDRLVQKGLAPKEG